MLSSAGRRITSLSDFESVWKKTNNTQSLILWYIVTMDLLQGLEGAFMEKIVP